MLKIGRIYWTDLLGARARTGGRRLFSREKRGEDIFSKKRRGSETRPRYLVNFDRSLKSHNDFVSMSREKGRFTINKNRRHNSDLVCKGTVCS